MAAIDLNELLLKLKWSEEGAQVPQRARAQLAQLTEEQAKLARAGAVAAGVGPGAAVGGRNAFQAGWASNAEILAAMARDAGKASTAVTQLGGAATTAGRGTTALRTALTGLAFHVTGTAGPVGRLSSALLMFGAGGAITLGVVGGLALVAGAFRLITKDAREASASAQDFLDQLHKLNAERAPAADALAAARLQLANARELRARFDDPRRIGRGVSDIDAIREADAAIRTAEALVAQLEGPAKKEHEKAGEGSAQAFLEGFKRRFAEAGIPELQALMTELQTRIAAGGAKAAQQFGGLLNQVVEQLIGATPRGRELLRTPFGEGRAFLGLHRQMAGLNVGAFGTGVGMGSAAQIGQAAAEQQHYAQALDFTRGVLARTLSPQQIFNQGMAQLQLILDSGAITTDQFSAAVAKLTDDMKKAQKGTGLLAVSIINAVSGAIAAVVSGGSGGGILSAIGGIVGLVNPVAGAIVGGLGAIVLAGESRGVTIDRYSREALEQLRGIPAGPQRIELLIQSPTTGEIVDRVIYTLGERTRNDGVRRVPLILAGR